MMAGSRRAMADWPEPAMCVAPPRTATPPSDDRARLPTVSRHREPQRLRRTKGARLRGALRLSMSCCLRTRRPRRAARERRRRTSPHPWPTAGGAQGGVLGGSTSGGAQGGVLGGSTPAHSRRALRAAAAARRGPPRPGRSARRRRIAVRRGGVGSRSCWTPALCSRNCASWSFHIASGSFHIAGRALGSIPHPSVAAQAAD